MLLLSVAPAADLTWTCPELTAPEDALPWSTPTELGSVEAIRSVIDAAYAVIPEECRAACADTSDGYCETLGCVTAAGDVFEWHYLRTDTTDAHGNWTTEVACDFDLAPVAAAWTSLVGSYTYQASLYATTSEHGHSSAEGAALEATWAGSLRDDWPTGGTVRAAWTVEATAGATTDEDARSEEWDDGSCSWSTRASADRDDETWAWEVQVGDHRVAVAWDAAGCPHEPIGSFDGATVGVVSATDWSESTSDTDNDGVSAGADDCDDADPAVNVCLVDPYVDGRDDDCDGTDGEDGDTDGDGYVSEAYGGPDCNDRSAAVNPDAEDRCDGFDNNCDGVVDDPVDDDADGWTVCDGDCDDDARDVYPGATEAADGIDNDCDEAIDEGAPVDSGDDTTDGPEAKDTGAPSGGCPGERAGGCAATGGRPTSLAVLLAALAWTRRRR